jgi:hypothetical protein
MNKITPEIVALFADYSLLANLEDGAWEKAVVANDALEREAYRAAVARSDSAYSKFHGACADAGLDHEQAYAWLKCCEGMPAVSLPNGTQIEWPYYSV